MDLVEAIKGGVEWDGDDESDDQDGGGDE